MEKTKLTVFRHETAEDPVVSAGFIARFKDLEVRTILLDEILSGETPQQQPPQRDYVVDHGTDSQYRYH